MIVLDLSILNQKGTPMFNSDLTANRPAAGIVGRIFIATDAPFGIFRDTGTAWDQVSSAGGGATIYSGDGTLTGNRTVSSGGYSLTFNPQTTFSTTNTADPNLSSFATISVNTTTFGAGFSANNIGSIFGAIGEYNLQTFAGSATFENSNIAANLTLSSIDFSSAGSTITMTQSTGLRVMSASQSQMQYQGTNSGTITHAAVTQNLGFYRPSAATGILTITNAYSHLINALDDYGAGFTFTNRWGIYQAGASDVNYFAANVLIGSTTNTGQKLQVSTDAKIADLTVGRGSGNVATNTVFGYQALNSNSSSSLHTAIGYQALFSKTTFIAETAVGYQSMYSNVNGVYNVSVGYRSMYSLTSGQKNTAIGYEALYSCNAESDNTAIGYNSLRLNTGNSNTAIGSEVMPVKTTGINNTGVGYNALKNFTNGNNNDAFGKDSMYFFTNGSFNAGIGRASLSALTSGDFNTAIGVSALFSATVSNENVGLGFAAGYGPTGANAVTTGSNNIFIGTYSGPVSATESNRTFIGRATTTSTWLAGNLLLGSTTSTGELLQLNGTLRVNGQTSASASGSSGQHLIINCDGVSYKIALLNP